MSARGFWSGTSAVLAAVALGGSAQAQAPAGGYWQDAEPCRLREGVPDQGMGPLPSGVGVADFGMVPEACPAFDVMARLRGVVLVASDAPDFYGNITGGLLLRVRHALDRRTWLSLALDAVTYRYVANAVVRSGAFGLGPPTFGVYHRLPLPLNAAIAVYGRLLLPLDTARDYGVQLGGELGLSAWIPIGLRHGLQGGVALPVPVDVTAGQAHGAFRPALLAETFWTPGKAFTLIAGAALRSEALPDPELRSLAARAAVQVALRGGLGLALAGEFPLFGTDRTDAVASLFAVWTSPGSRAQRRLARTEQMAILPRSHAQD